MKSYYSLSNSSTTVPLYSLSSNHHITLKRFLEPTEKFPFTHVRARTISFSRLHRKASPIETVNVTTGEDASEPSAAKNVVDDKDVSPSVQANTPSGKKQRQSSKKYRMGDIVEFKVEKVENAVMVRCENGIQGVILKDRISTKTPDVLPFTAKEVFYGEVVTPPTNQRCLISTSRLETEYGQILKDKGAVLANVRNFKRKNLGLWQSFAWQSSIDLHWPRLFALSECLAEASQGEAQDKLSKQSELARIDKIRPGQFFYGPVVKVAAKGAFVRIHPVLDAFLHVSLMSQAFVENPSQFLKLGSMVAGYVTSVEPNLGFVRLASRHCEPTPGLMVTDPAATYKNGCIQDALFKLDGVETALRNISKRTKSSLSVQGSSLEKLVGTVVEGFIFEMNPTYLLIKLDNLEAMGNLNVQQITSAYINVKEEFKVGERIRCLVLQTFGDRVVLSTKVLEAYPRQMLEDRDAVYEHAEQEAEKWRQKHMNLPPLTEAEVGVDFTSKAEYFRQGQVVEGTVQDFLHSKEAVLIRLEGGGFGLIPYDRMSSRGKHDAETAETIFKFGDRVRAKVVDKLKYRHASRIILSTSALESTSGQMFRDPEGVFNNAEAEARKRMPSKDDDDAKNSKLIHVWADAVQYLVLVNQPAREMDTIVAERYNTLFSKLEALLSREDFQEALNKERALKAVLRIIDSCHLTALKAEEVPCLQLLLEVALGPAPYPSASVQTADHGARTSTPSSAAGDEATTDLATLEQDTAQAETASEPDLDLKQGPRSAAETAPSTQNEATTASKGSDAPIQDTVTESGSNLDHPAPRSDQSASEAGQKEVPTARKGSSASKQGAQKAPKKVKTAVALTESEERILVALSMFAYSPALSSLAALWLNRRPLRGATTYTYSPRAAAAFIRLLALSRISDAKSDLYEACEFAVSAPLVMRPWETKQIVDDLTDLKFVPPITWLVTFLHNIELAMREGSQIRAEYSSSSESADASTADAAARDAAAAPAGVPVAATAAATTADVAAVDAAATAASESVASADAATIGTAAAAATADVAAVNAAATSASKSVATADAAAIGTAATAAAATTADVAAVDTVGTAASKSAAAPDAAAIGSTATAAATTAVEASNAAAVHLETPTATTAPAVVDTDAVGTAGASTAPTPHSPVASTLSGDGSLVEAESPVSFSSPDRPVGSKVAVVSKERLKGDPFWRLMLPVVMTRLARLRRVKDRN